MRAWVDIYDTTDTKVGTVYNVVSLSVKKALDGAGTISFSTPGVDDAALSLLTSERRAKLYVEHDNVSRLVGSGVIRKITKSASSNGYQLNVSGPDSMDALNRKSVLLGRSFTNTAISSIASTLAGLAGWTAVVDDGLGSQTARYDGVSALKALIRTATEKGLHIREGLNANEIELGAFGTDNGVWAIAPQTITRELMANDNVVIVDSITQETDSQDVVNWIVPLGAGEGSAALTLKNAVATGAYAIGTTTAPDGSTLYYLTDSTSVATYGQCEKIVTFKEIGAVSNSDTAKTYAAQALYDAACAWLDRNKDPLVTYRCSVRKPRTSLRAGDKMRLTYKGFVETAGGDLVPINVDELFWIMEATERIAESGDSYDLTLASVDRVAKDTTSIVVDALESMAARNLAVATFPTWIINSSKDFIQTDTSTGGLSWKPAIFKMKIDNLVTDIISAKLQFKTETLFATAQLNTAVGWFPVYNQIVLKGTTYPNGVTLFINGIDVTSALGGPWGNGTAAIDVELDISSYIINAVGGIYQDHSIEFQCAVLAAPATINYPNYQAASSVLASNGVVYCETRALVMTRATIPAP